MSISFRIVQTSDLPNIIRWMQDEDVSRWWYEDGSEEAIRAKWEPRARGEDDKTDRYVINVEGTDIGIIQTCLVADHPEYSAEIQVPESAGIDVFIGLSEWRNRGVGTRMVSRFLEELVFVDPAVRRCTIDPEPANKRAIRTYEKVGFRHARTYRSKIDNVDVYLMVKEREAD